MTLTLFKNRIKVTSTVALHLTLNVTVKGQTRDPNTLRAQYLENYLSYWLQIWQAVLYCNAEQAHK